MKLTAYVCNLCRTKGEFPEGFSGIYFASNKIEIRSAIQCENHLCNNCLAGMRDLANAGDIDADLPESMRRKAVMS